MFSSGLKVDRVFILRIYFKPNFIKTLQTLQARLGRQPADVNFQVFSGTIFKSRGSPEASDGGIL